MTNEQTTELLIAEWTAKGWSEEDIQESLISWFTDSPFISEEE